ncbi:MAG: hypothetical protein U9P42_09960 [Candidatus Fermentibacteria bacterium]|nr:hypothetical protein [Candidatus Fermentibacteria bacterium]
MRMRIIVTILFIAGAVSASPLDTAYDLLDAVTYQDGYALENVFAQDLYSTLTEFLNQTRILVEADPVLAGNILQQRYRGRITVDDFAVLNNEELLGKIMGEVHLQPDQQIQQESVNMEGRNATVVLLYFNGASVSFRMVWEDSNWRIADTSLLATLFN